MDSFPEAKPENDEAGSLFEKALDGFGPLDIAMANAGLEGIDVPFTTLKNLTDHPGHLRCDRQINCSIEHERGDFAIPRVPECGAPYLDGISP